MNDLFNFTPDGPSTLLGYRRSTLAIVCLVSGIAGILQILPVIGPIAAISRGTWQNTRSKKVGGGQRGWHGNRGSAHGGYHARYGYSSFSWLCSHHDLGNSLQLSNQLLNKEHGLFRGIVFRENWLYTDLITHVKFLIMFIILYHG